MNDTVSTRLTRTLRRLTTYWSAQRIASTTVILSVITVVVMMMHPSLLLSGTTLTGGDTGSHIAAPMYLRQHFGSLSLTPWDSGWYAGFPLYTYYFVLPDALVALASYVVSFTVAFKLATILGSLLMPIAAYAMARLFRAPHPIPEACAAATLPFLFDASFTIDGGNLFSTMAGEYSFSLSLALALITVGLFARGMRTGKGRWAAAVFLSLTLAAHLLPWLYALVMIAVLVVLEVIDHYGGFDRDRGPRPRHHTRRVLWFSASAGLLSLGFSAWWLLPFATSQQYTNSMGYTNNPVSTIREIFTPAQPTSSSLGWWNFHGGAGGDRWVIVVAVLALLMAFFWRDRLGITLTLSAVISMVAYIVDPQSAIWNERLVPFWYLSIYLSAGWLVGATLWRLCRSRRVTSLLDSVMRRDGEGLDDADVATIRESRRIVNATFVVALLGLGVTLPGIVPWMSDAVHITEGPNQVANWAQWNYSGYESKPAWPEYHGIITTVETVAHRYGCGRAMWEYNGDSTTIYDENRFGTSMALMLLPYWTNNCVGSMEGLFFEASATTPYHFLDQAELSAEPSNPMVGLSYGGVDVGLGVQHLQMLGVQYFMAFSPSVIAQCRANHNLVQVAVTRRWPSGVRWHIYLVRNSPLVSPVTTLPSVVAGIDSRTSWLNANQQWWLDPSTSPILMASNGPANWPRQNVLALERQLVADRTDVQSAYLTNSGLAFDVRTSGRPIYLTVSTTPSWTLRGGVGPLRVGRDRYQVTPTSTHVVITFDRVKVPSSTVSHVVMRDQSISFHVSRLGVPVLVKISYYPRWHAMGASGPYRVSPNLMVVVPTSHNVTLVYGSSPAVLWGNVVTDLTVLGLVIALWRRRRWRRPRGQLQHATH